jgi:proton-dependent oligopeptide transporter, POT family
LLSLSIYTRLFDQLGLLALVGAAMALALLPVINRLSVAHDASRAARAVSTEGQPAAAA